MRGFRGNRAAQNLMSFRYGGNQPHLPKGDQNTNNHSPQTGNQAPGQHSALPEWMKTPETKALEQQQQNPARPQAVVKGPPQLKIIQGGKATQAAAAPVVATTPVKKKKAAATAPRKRAVATKVKAKAKTKAKAPARTTTAAKRKKAA